MSLIGALTHLGEAPFERRVWVKAVAAYTACGCISATLVGACLGFLGGWLGTRPVNAFGLIVACILGLILAAREWRWIEFPLPQRSRQTEKRWAHQFGFLTASALWGFDIGIGFATQMTTGGFWILASVAFVLGSPSYGALLLVVYWLGRASTVWSAPALIVRGSDTYDLLEVIDAEWRLIHKIAGVGLVWSAVVTVVLAMHT